MFYYICAIMLTLVAQGPKNQYAIQWSNGCWTVIDYSAGLCVLDLHNEAKAFDSVQRISLLNNRTIMPVSQSRRGTIINTVITWICGLHYCWQKAKHFKLSILESNNQLLFL